ncbi:hypothetical protein WA026_002705 [Henosepilachna vigintioctopunctata]|uniref:Cytochrome P450 n=1 Tax=Henosepilachna vigintioctopunctata TaxID=420089 RepID=A0AAW1U2F6_9CUCU
MSVPVASSEMDNGIAKTVYAFPVILALLIVTWMMWFLKYRNEKRRIYELMATVKQPPSCYPIFGHSLNFVGTPTYAFQKITEYFFNYGPNFGIWFGNMPLVVIGKPEDLETVLMSQHCVSKSYFYKFTGIVVGEGLFSAPAHKWRRNRKLIQPTFNSRILDHFVQIFGNTSSICVNEILPKYINKRNIEWYNIFTSVNLDTISQTAMGINTDAQRIQIPFSKHLEIAMKAVYLRFVTIYYHLDFIFNRTSLCKELRASAKYIDGFTDKVIKEKKAEFNEKLKDSEQEVSTFDEAPIKRKVFLEMLLEIDHKGMKFTDKELRDEVKTFFVGGTDTSAVTTCFFLSMMGMHQEIQQQVYEEIMEVVGEERTPEPEDLPKFQLLERCIKETCRLFSPAPFVSRKVKGKDVTLSEFTLPVGTTLLLPIFYVHRCADYWDEPLKFKPERFRPEEVAKRHPYTFLPFSAGLRGCVGMRYSYMNMKTLLSMILRKYKVYCDYKSIEEIKVKNYVVLRPIDGFKFHIQERK